MKKKLVIDAPALSRLLELPREQKVACLLAISDIPSAFGRPHLHSGLSIRKLRPGWFECRANLDWRIIFKDRSDDLFVAFIGNHDEVQKLLRSGLFDR